MQQKILSGTTDQIQAQLEAWGLEYEEGKTYYSKLPEIEAVIMLGRRISEDGEYDEEGNETKAPTYTPHHFIHCVLHEDLPLIDPGLKIATHQEAKHQIAGLSVTDSISEEV
jgi:hypothetical protein